jgi:hypothetical protein
MHVTREMDFAAGVLLKTVQELMGHKTIHMTARYAHLSPSHLQNAVELLSGKNSHLTATGNHAGLTATRTATRRKQAAQEGSFWLRGIARKLFYLFSLLGGEGGIRTPDSLTTMPDFESGAFNRALPPLRAFTILPEEGHSLLPSDADLAPGTATVRKVHFTCMTAFNPAQRPVVIHPAAGQWPGG